MVIIFLDNVTLSAEELLSIIFNIEEGKEVCDDFSELEKEGTYVWFCKNISMFKTVHLLFLIRHDTMKYIVNCM